MQLTSNYINPDEYKQIVMSLSENSFENEIWADVCGVAKNYYEVSSLGRFRAKQDIYYHGRSCRFHKDGELIWKQKQIIPQKLQTTYFSVNLYIPYLLSQNNPCSNVSSHILISKSFLSENINDGLVTDHINGNKKDNRICNLQRITIQENNAKSYINNESNHDENWREPIICVETNKLYSHIKDACDEFGVSSSAMINGIKRGGTVSGFHWKYVDDKKQNIINNKLPEKRTGITTQSNWVKCAETDDIMLCTDMARKFGRSRSEFIYESIDYYNGYFSKFDVHFELIDEKDIDFMSDKIQNYIKNIYYRKDRVIHCLEDDLYFMSTTQAANYYGVSPYTIKYSRLHNKPLNKKYTFEKLVS